MRSEDDCVYSIAITKYSGHAPCMLNLSMLFMLNFRLPLFCRLQCPQGSYLVMHILCSLSGVDRSTRSSAEPVQSFTMARVSGV